MKSQMIRDYSRRDLVLHEMADKKAATWSKPVHSGHLSSRRVGRYGTMRHTETPGWTGYYIDGVLVHEDGDSFPTYFYEEDDLGAVSEEPAYRGADE